MPKSKEDKMLDKLRECVFDLTYDMYLNADIPKNEIKAMLGLTLRNSVDEVFRENFDQKRVKQ